jgi:two-component system, OmpR family, sensor histidine kinase CiaH
MFNEARTKLTLYYLTIIMIISLFFSGIVYKSLTFELNRIENMQRMRRANASFSIDPEIISETKSRILSSLIIINTAILVVSGLSGYFLAGKTLNPIQKMMDEQKEFISDASHELRTPLSSLKSQIEVALRSKKLSLGESRRILESNLEDVNNMTNLSNYLLKLNKEQNGKTLLKKVDLAEIVSETVGKKEVNLNLVKTIISGDRDSLKELVNILVDNAIKYGEGKEISISLKSKTLKVTDHGLGISQKDLPHIFNRFYRSDRARGKDGYGLGLSIAKQIVDNHNAKIKVESKLGIGTTFKVIFS